MKSIRKTQQTKWKHTLQSVCAGVTAGPFCSGKCFMLKRDRGLDKLSSFQLVRKPLIDVFCAQCSFFGSIFKQLILKVFSLPIPCNAQFVTLFSRSEGFPARDIWLLSVILPGPDQMETVLAWDVAAAAAVPPPPPRRRPPQGISTGRYGHSGPIICGGTARYGH